MRGTSSPLPEHGGETSTTPWCPDPGQDAPAWLQVSGSQTTGHWSLLLLDRLELRLDADERACTWYWYRQGSNHAEPLSWEPDLLAPLDDPSVLAIFGDQWLKQYSTHDRLDMPGMEECRATMQARVSEDSQFAGWQREWCRVLSACQPGVLDLACRSRLATDDELELSLYSIVWRHDASFRDVALNAPRLLSMLAILVESGWQPPQSGNVLKAMREVVCSLASCGPATWRWLLEHGLDGIESLIVFLNDDPWPVVSQFLSLWTRAGLPPQMPEPVMDLWAHRFVRAHQLEALCPERVAMVARHAATLDDEQAHRQSEEIVTILQMAAEPLLPPLDPNQKRAGWSWLRKEPRQRERICADQERVVSPLRARLPSSLRIDYFELVILRDEAGIVEEGQRMNNCLQDDPRSFMNDGRLHFSLRCSVSGESIATCSLGAKGARLVVTEALGLNNDPAPGVARRAAQRLASHPRLMRLLKGARA